MIERHDSVITEPGMYDIPAANYHADDITSEPTLSNSIVRLLDSGASPRHVTGKHPRLMRPEWCEFAESGTDAQKLGQVIHGMLLGVDGDYVAKDPDEFRIKDGSPAKSWGAKEASIWKDYIEASGKIVIARETERKARLAADGMLDAIRVEFPTWDDGVSERTLVWRWQLNDGGHVWCRARPDRILMNCECESRPKRHKHIFDAKSTGKPVYSDQALDAKIGLEGWDIQHVFYVAGARAVFGEDVPFTFVVEESFPPFEPWIVDIPDEWLALTRQRVDVAAQTFGRCLREGSWPGRARRRIVVGAPPNWLVSRWEESLEIATSKENS